MDVAQWSTLVTGGIAILAVLVTQHATERREIKRLQADRDWALFTYRTERIEKLLDEITRLYLTSRAMLEDCDHILRDPHGDHTFQVLATEELQRASTLISLNLPAEMPHWNQFVDAISVEAIEVLRHFHATELALAEVTARRAEIAASLETSSAALLAIRAAAVDYALSLARAAEQPSARTANVTDVVKHNLEYSDRRFRHTEKETGS